MGVGGFDAPESIPPSQKFMAAPMTNSDMQWVVFSITAAGEDDEPTQIIRRIRRTSNNYPESNEPIYIRVACFFFFGEGEGIACTKYYNCSSKRTFYHVPKTNKNRAKKIHP